MLARGWAPLAAGAGLVALVVVVAINVLGTAPRPLGSNLIRPLAFDVVLRGGEEVCQPVEHVPAGTAGIGVRVGTYGRPGPPLRTRITSPGAPVASGRLAAGWREGDVVAPVDEVTRARDDAAVCIRNEGERRIAFAGYSLGSAEFAEVGGTPVDTNIRVEYARAGSDRWIDRVGSVADRVAATRVAPPGEATFWLWGLLVLAVLGGAVALVLREARP